MSAPRTLEQRAPSRRYGTARVARWPTENRLDRVLELVAERYGTHCLFQIESRIWGVRGRLVRASFASEPWEYELLVSIFMVKPKPGREAE